MYKPKNLLSNTFMHKNNIKTPKIHKARASYLKKPKKKRFSCALWKKRASGAMRR
ncbi:hypothetical protein HanXRQr2_Chr16g0769031 [Helianthus annuus]|uniref:Uncharacterized protein n=1 Tax=Helianthus annuus TaxID=4232 RepID=A0A9K3DUK0_HELAN|nr:hypothetical protein HanXRQr2_Chr16g0769031 [Helianthus annuus]KAJ0822866.1 hypothetical protein HanPSC8_Chr16g0737051 [Helianthus annuus]